MASLRLALVLSFCPIAIAALACGGGSSSATSTRPPTVIATPTQPGVATLGDPGLTVRNAIEACREKDAPLLKTFVAGDVSLTDIATLFARGSDVQLLSQTVPEPSGNIASITVHLRIRRDGRTDEVDRTWDLVRGDDSLWRLTQLPDCF